jgi:hypothetical protein
MEEGFSRNEERAAGVGLEDGVPLFEGEFLKGGCIKDCGVVDEQIKALEARNGRGYSVAN